MVEKATRVKLTQKEEQLFAKLLQVCKDKGLKTTLRVAGGWTRDKVRKCTLTGVVSWQRERRH